MNGKEPNNPESERQAHRVHLPGFITDEDIGLGEPKPSVLCLATTTWTSLWVCVDPSPRRKCAMG
jgi:hypothetical protein